MGKTVVSTLVVRSNQQVSCPVQTEGGIWRSGTEPGDTDPGNGTDDEATGRDLESDCEEAELGSDISIRYGPHGVGVFDKNGERRGKVESPKPASHFPTA